MHDELFEEVCQVEITSAKNQRQVNFLTTETVTLCGCVVEYDRASLPTTENFHNPHLSPILREVPEL